MGKIGQKFSELKKEQRILVFVIPLIIIAVCCAAFFGVRYLKSDKLTETGTVSAQTIIENYNDDVTAANTLTSIKNEPSVKPVGTTKPVEKESSSGAERVSQGVNFNDPNLVLLDVPYINQNEKYPTACESISSVMALQYAGYAISPEEFIDDYLPKGYAPFTDANGIMFGDDPRECFLGNPYRANGWGCYSQVIEKSLADIIDSSQHTVKNFAGASLNTICAECIDNDIPVIIWATQGMAEPRSNTSWYLLDDDSVFTWVSPNHCLLLVGYDDNYYYFNDPQTAKNYRYTKSTAEKRYAFMGSQALAIFPQTQQTTKRPSWTFPNIDFTQSTAQPGEENTSENSFDVTTTVKLENTTKIIDND